MTAILVIGGTDSSGGAGLTRDVAVASSLGVEVRPVVTMVTAQTNRALRVAQVMPKALVHDQIAAAYGDTPPLAVKIGALGSAAIAEAVAAALAPHSLPVVVDPVLASTSGGVLMADPLPAALFQQVLLLTPNLPEAAALTGQSVALDFPAIAAQARLLQNMGAGAVLMKGGHAAGDEAIDHLFHAGGRLALTGPRHGRDRRGTGCALATAITCHIALGRPLPEACRLAKAFVGNWIGDGALNS